MKKAKKLTKLEELRIKNNLTYQDMADALKISKAYYWQIENGNRNLYYTMAKNIAELFNMKPDELFYDDLK